MISRQIRFCRARAPSDRRRSVQTYHDCTCAPICHLMSQLLAVQQGHVYEGGNQSGWRRERNLKSLSLSFSLFFSFSRCVVAPCTVNTNHTIRKHIHIERCVTQTRACIRLLHFSTHKIRTKNFLPFRISGTIEEDYPKDSRAIFNIDTERGIDQ